MEPLTDLDSERWLCSCAMVDDDAAFGSIPKALREVSHEDFSDPRLAHVWKAAQSVLTAGGPIHFISIGEMLSREGNLESMGGKEFLWDLAEMSATSTRIGYFANIVKDYAARRRLRSAGAMIAQDAAFDPTRELAEVLASSQERLSAVPKNMEPLKSTSIREYLDHYIANCQNGPFVDGGFPTGFDELDRTILGLFPHQLITIAGRPGMGKTTLALNIAQHVFHTLGKRVVFFSMEMQASELMDRMLASESGIPLASLRNQDMVKADKDKITKTRETLASRGELLFYDQSSQNIASIVDVATNRHRELPIDLIVVDYIQLILTANRETRAQEVANVTRQLKALAGTLNVPVLALSQLNRNAERDDRPPRLSDLRESGAIEQDSDVVLLLHQPNKEQTPSGFLEYELLIAKQRQGPVGSARLYFDRQRVRFTNPPYDFVA